MAALLLLGGCSGGDASGGSQPVPSPAPTPAPTPVTTMNVLYLGGSVTEGVGASATATSWAGLTSTWLRGRYTTVNERNLAVSSTSSDFAVHRLESDLGSFAPDLAFVEFVLNDALLPQSVSNANTDAIVARLRARNPRVRIVYVAVTTPLEESARRAGSRFERVTAAEQLARTESIDFVDTGQLLWQRVVGGTAVSSLFADPYHPSDAGHRIYHDAIRATVEPLLAAQPTARATSTYIAQTGLDSAVLLPASAASGCRPGAAAGRYLTTPIACTAGDRFTVDFNGTSIGFVHAYRPDGGRLSCTLDGATPRSFDFWDPDQPQTTYVAGGILYRYEAPAGSHRLECTVATTPPSASGATSRGTQVIIGGFMVNAGRASAF